MPKFKAALLDKAYDNELIRIVIKENNGKAIIPNKKNKLIKVEFNEFQYKNRHLIENMFSYLKEHRKVHTRFEKLDSRFLSFIHLASIKMLLR